MIKVEGLRVELGSFQLNDINLEIGQGEYFILLGPTAAGKTVLLESIAGLVTLAEGRIYIGGTDISGLTPEKRGISLVYQDHALFPHLTVRNNITYGLRIRRRPAAEINDVLEWLDGLLGIRYMLERRPGSLSGGEKQKAALARALSVRPEVLLLDEPLSALDPETRENVRNELKSVHRIMKNTVIHVTHDFEEAMSLGSRISVLGEGRIQQTGTPEEVFRRPQSRFVAGFTLMRNIYHGETLNRNNSFIFKTGDTTLVLEGHHAASTSCYAGIRPEDVEIYGEEIFSPSVNVFEARIRDIQDRGSTLFIVLESLINIQCLLTRRHFGDKGLSPGDRVKVYLNPSAIHTFGR
ncbi:MAG: ABC transporter ATP-binding protein [Dehalococcoidales bacterium]|nr:ABC transporter ATP-binding protein [Dehalococcoidales bacterium]